MRFLKFYYDFVFFFIKLRDFETKPALLLESQWFKNCKSVLYFL